MIMCDILFPCISQNKSSMQLIYVHKDHMQTCCVSEDKEEQKNNNNEEEWWMEAAFA